jgi:hypothetical protein
MAKLGTVLTVAVWATIAGLVGMFFYSMGERKAEETRLRNAIANLMDEEQHAQLMVDLITTDDVTGEVTTHLRWAEVEPNGEAFPGAKAKPIVVKGSDVYIDSWQIIFDPSSIKEGDPFRGKSLTLFSRIYGELQAPNAGVPLQVPRALPKESETAGLIPPAFRTSTGEVGEFEQSLWRQFFSICTDAEVAKKAGVRTVQGTAVHKPVVQGKMYRIKVDRKGQITFGNPEDPPPFTGQ